MNRFSFSACLALSALLLLLALIPGRIAVLAVQHWETETIHFECGPFAGPCTPLQILVGSAGTALVLLAGAGGLLCVAFSFRNARNRSNRPD